MPRPPLWYLKDVELFEGVSEEEMHSMVQGIFDRQYDNKEFLYTAQEKPENVYILKDGEVTLYQSNGGRKVILDILKPGAVFGNIGFDSETSEPHYAEVTQKSYICTLPHNLFLQLIQQRPDIALRVLNIMSKRLSQYQSQIQALSSLNARGRILATLRILDQKEENSILPNVLRKPTRITHEKLGNMTGLTRETVTKQLKELEHEGLVSVNHKEIHLTQQGIKSLMALK